MVPKSSSFYATTSLSSCKKSAIHYSPKKTARASNSATSFFGLESREPTTIPINIPKLAPYDIENSLVLFGYLYNNDT